MSTYMKSLGKHRGKWLTINSVSNISWFITAPIGGYIVDRFGYRSVPNSTVPKWTVPKWTVQKWTVPKWYFSYSLTVNVV